MIDTNDPRLIGAVLATDPPNDGQEPGGSGGGTGKWANRETHCQHLKSCATSSCPACDPTPTSFRCPSCKTDAHRATCCPDVALVKYGMGIWEAYIENHAAFLKLVQWAASPRLLLMGEAVAFYLSHRWGHPITGYQVLAGWQTNAALT